MDFLTSTVLSGIAWDGIKKFGSLTKEYLKYQLKEWVLDDFTCEKIAKKINDIPSEYKKSSKFIEAAIDEDEEIINILRSVKHDSLHVQNNSGSFFKDSNIVNGSGNSTGNITNNFYGEIPEGFKAQFKSKNEQIEKCANRNSLK